MRFLETASLISWLKLEQSGGEGLLHDDEKVKIRQQINEAWSVKIRQHLIPGRMSVLIPGPLSKSDHWRKLERPEQSQIAKLR